MYAEQQPRPYGTNGSVSYSPSTNESVYGRSGYGQVGAYGPASYISPSHGHAYSPPGSPVNERPAELLLNTTTPVVAFEISSSSRREVDRGPLTILSVEPTREEAADLARANLGQRHSRNEFGMGPHAPELTFIVIGQSKIPLVKNIPVTKVNSHYFVVDLPGLPLGIEFANRTDAGDLDIFESLVAHHSTLRHAGSQENRMFPPQPYHQEVQQPPAARQKPLPGQGIANGISTIGGIAVSALSKGASISESALKKGGGWALSKTTPNEQPVQVGRGTKMAVGAAKGVTKVGVKVTGSLVNGLVAVCTTAGGAVARSLPGSGANGKDVGYVGVVGGQCLTSCSQVLHAWDDAKDKVVDCATSHCEKVVHHKYGEDAAALARDSGCVLKNCSDAYGNVTSMAPKKILKKAGKQTAKSGISAYMEGPPPPQPRMDYPPQPASYVPGQQYPNGLPGSYNPYQPHGY